jgi:hydroxyacylglutathione hydrolase
MEIHRFVFSPISVNTYVLEEPDGTCAVIDCGCYDESEFAELTEFIDSRKLKPVLLLNTHCHLDHIFGNGMFLKKYGLKTRACINEEENRRSSQNHAMIFGLEMENPPEIGQHIDDNEKITFGSVTLEALYVPGHSAGSIAFYCKDAESVFTGDALFAGGIGRTDLQGGNYDQLITNIKTRLLTLPPDTVVYPGHGESSTIQKEMSTNRWLS